jgi:hypothetical protein
MKRHLSNQFDDAKSLIVKRTELNEVYNPARNLLQRQLAEVGQTSAACAIGSVRSVSMTEASSLDPHRCERPMRVSQNVSTLRTMQPRRAG